MLRLKKEVFEYELDILWISESDKYERARCHFQIISERETSEVLKSFDEYFNEHEKGQTIQGSEGFEIKDYSLVSITRDSSRVLFIDIDGFG